MNKFSLALLLVAPISLWGAASSPDAPEGQASRAVQILRGHRQLIESISFNPKGETLASGSRDGTVRIWDIKTGACLRVLKDFIGAPLVAYSPDGKTLATAAGKIIRMVDVETGIELSKEYPVILNAIAYHPSGDVIAIGDISGAIFILNAKTGECVKMLQGHGRAIYSLTYNCAGTQLASGSSDSVVRLWNAETGACKDILTGHEGFAKSIAYSFDDKKLAVGSGEGTVRIWDLETYACRGIKCHDKDAVDVAYNPNAATFAIAQGTKICIRDVESLKRLKCYSRGRGGSLSAVAYSPDGKALASGAEGNTVQLWHLDASI